MTDSPFGGFDFNAILGKAQAMQASMAETQQRLASAEITGTVGGGAVNVTITGAGDLVRVDLKAGEFDGNDADNLTDLGDLIVAAYRDAKTKADAMAQENLSSSLGGLTAGLPDLPGLEGLFGGGAAGSAGPTGDGTDEPPMKLGF